MNKALRSTQDKAWGGNTFSLKGNLQKFRGPTPIRVDIWKLARTPAFPCTARSMEKSIIAEPFYVEMGGLFVAFGESLILPLLAHMSSSSEKKEKGASSAHFQCSSENRCPMAEGGNISQAQIMMVALSRLTGDYTQCCQVKRRLLLTLLRYIRSQVVGYVHVRLHLAGASPQCTFPSLCVPQRKATYAMLKRRSAYAFLCESACAFHWPAHWCRRLSLRLGARTNPAGTLSSETVNLTNFLLGRSTHNKEQAMPGHIHTSAFVRTVHQGTSPGHMSGSVPSTSFPHVSALKAGPHDPTGTHQHFPDSVDIPCLLLQERRTTYLCPGRTNGMASHGSQGILDPAKETTPERACALLVLFLESTCTISMSP